MNRHILKRDLQFIFLNHFANHIPSWTIRRIIYTWFGVKIGKGARIALCTEVLSPQKIVIEERSIINEGCFLDGRGGLMIGKDCSISHHTTIITAAHKANSNAFEYYESGVCIRDNVWTGVNATILDGSEINEGCIIGAGAVIKGTTQKNGVYVGNPAKLIKMRELGKPYKLDYCAYFK